jgi:small subunit ribosomal protein S3
MGQKSNPIGLRLQINRTWDSRWYADGAAYSRLLLEDLKIRKFIMKELPQAAISKVVIERPAKLCRVSIYAARPGVIIGKKGATSRSSQEARLDDLVRRVAQHRRNPQAGDRRAARRAGHRRSARAPDRVPPRHEARRSVGHAARRDGIRVACGGRLGGAEIARSEMYREGRVPLHTLRGNVDYAEARLTPLMACAASRSGSSRARSSATTR